MELNEKSTSAAESQREMARRADQSERAWLGTAGCRGGDASRPLIGWRAGRQRRGAASCPDDGIGGLIDEGGEED